jgi:hypothetical protein
MAIFKHKVKICVNDFHSSLQNIGVEVLYWFWANCQGKIHYPQYSSQLKSSQVVIIVILHIICRSVSSWCYVSIVFWLPISNQLDIDYVKRILVCAICMLREIISLISEIVLAIVLRNSGCFLRVLRFAPPIKLTATI